MRKPATLTDPQHLQHKNASDDQLIRSICSTLSNASDDYGLTGKSIIEQTEDIKNHKAPSCSSLDSFRGETCFHTSISVLQVQRVAQVDWFIGVAGIMSFDLGSRQSDVSLYLRSNIPGQKVYDFMGWLAFNNTHGNREAQIRPHRHDAVPLIFFDDVQRDVALRIAAKYSACVVETSNQGGCHVWVNTDRALTENERYLVQKHLHKRIDADAGSISGEHFGRMCGFKNWKRGCWVNLLATTDIKPLAITKPMLADVHAEVHRKSEPRYQVVSDLTVLTSTGRDSSNSGQDWGWVNEQLAMGADRDSVETELADRAASRGKPRADAYAHRTVENAIKKLGL
ncbi:hypothetical protein FE236_02140 [Mariprofundus erugo]|uniref:DNA-primase RepB domain-containing protein n=1 Tax=Mariprofundus erugo TaxID=2528639 RepID=UPI0010FD6B26|nr:DNA-primase RepB domain-containing protein [Mariprofundus erugo]TLS77922.1 hypothetical protein FE236_02140 [Mariprofundus erugo]